MMMEQTFVLQGGAPLFSITAPLLTWYRQNARVLPWRENTDPYRVWVSEIMLQQTRVDTVIPYYERFLRAFPDIPALAAAEQDRLLKHWEGLGYYSRVKNMQRAAQIICAEHGGVFPRDFKAVRALPGIGDYTAGAICSIAFEQKCAAVDGNVLRVISRLCASSVPISDPKLKAAVTQALTAVYPETGRGDFTQSLMELGAIVCLPGGAPLCEKCPLSHLCTAHACGRETDFPVFEQKRARKKQTYTVFLLHCGDKLALTRREEPGVLHGLWQLPCAEGVLTPEQAAHWLSEHDVDAGEIRAGAHKKHVFTHIEWSMPSFEVHCARQSPLFVWATPADLAQQYPLPTAFRKFLKK